MGHRSNTLFIFQLFFSHHEYHFNAGLGILGSRCLQWNGLDLKGIVLLQCFVMLWNIVSPFLLLVIQLFHLLLLPGIMCPQCHLLAFFNSHIRYNDHMVWYLFQLELLLLVLLQDGIQNQPRLHSSILLTFIIMCGVPIPVTGCTSWHQEYSIFWLHCVWARVSRWWYTFHCKKGLSVGSACKPVNNDDGICEPAQSLSDSIKETSTSNEKKVWYEGMAFAKHKSLRDSNHFCCSCWHSEKGCTDVLKVFDDGQVSISDAHATSYSHKNGVTVPSSLVSTAGNVCKDRMH